MTEPASAIGFALAFVAASWLISAAFGAAVELGLAERRGPAADRAAAAAVLIGAPVLALILTATLVAHSAASGGADHCASHGHHLHLCVFHGGAWAEQPAAVVLLAMIGMFLGVRVLQKLVGVLAARRRLARLRAVGREDDGVVLVPAELAFCFVAGFGRPRIYVSTATWNALAIDEREAMLAHERTHLAARDPLRRFALGLLALVGAPWLAARMLARWSAATERLCDAAAAHAVDPVAVASALLRLARAGAPPPAGAIGFPAGAQTISRIESLLAAAPLGRRAATFIRRSTWIGLAASVVLAGVLADPIHHVFETLLGAL